MDKKQRGTSKQERTKDFLSTKDYFTDSPENYKKKLKKLRKF